jgi:hypothetical protein
VCAGGDPQLWAEALEYFCSQPGDCSAAISQVLQHIEAGELLPPLVVLQTLAKNKNLKVRWLTLKPRWLQGFLRAHLPVLQHNAGHHQATAVSCQANVVRG